MMHSLSRDEVREIDRCAIEVTAVPGVILMENAGRNAADAIERFFFGGPTGTAGKAVAVVAGSGNNGGDGCVVARHLAMRGGRVVTFLTSPRAKIRGDALVNLNIIENLGHDVRSLADDDAVGELGALLTDFDVIVDAIGGTGIRGPLRGDAATAVQQVNAASRPTVAVDIPTGLDCDTGLAAGMAVRAAMTVTFVARKKGFDAAESREFTGEVVVADIGIPANGGNP